MGVGYLLGVPQCLYTPTVCMITPIDHLISNNCPMGVSSAPTPSVCDYIVAI